MPEICTADIVDRRKQMSGCFNRSVGTERHLFKSAKKKKMTYWLGNIRLWMGWPYNLLFKEVEDRQRWKTVVCIWHGQVGQPSNRGWLRTELCLLCMGQPEHNYAWSNYTPPEQEPLSNRQEPLSNVHVCCWRGTVSVEWPCLKPVRNSGKEDKRFQIAYQLSCNLDDSDS